MYENQYDGAKHHRVIIRGLMGGKIVEPVSIYALMERKHGDSLKSTWTIRNLFYIDVDVVARRGPCIAENLPSASMT